ncbi:hypothetical protein Nepgr_033624 [Nepenthes gracilis]|uniref:Uncharacterized protein n=1 Tax=Nepenthes gracilis TaxID=150966 RepID=A0AAD3TLI4_NEPGR|nr:hypothetical protein Nepgr_033624 [Nepenthes gracilis]
MCPGYELLFLPLVAADTISWDWFDDWRVAVPVWIAVGAALPATNIGLIADASAACWSWAAVYFYGAVFAITSWAGLVLMSCVSMAGSWVSVGGLVGCFEGSWLLVLLKMSLLIDLVKCMAGDIIFRPCSFLVSPEIPAIWMRADAGDGVVEMLQTPFAFSCWIYPNARRQAMSVSLLLHTHFCAVCMDLISGGCFFCSLELSELRRYSWLMLSAVAALDVLDVDASYPGSKW